MKNKEMKSRLSRIESRICNLGTAVRSLLRDIDRDEQKSLLKTEKTKK